MLADVVVSLDEKVFVLLVEERVLSSRTLAVEEPVEAVLRIEVVLLDVLGEVAIDLECHVLRVDVLEREVEDADGPFGVAVVDLHEAALKGIDRLLQQLPRRLVLI